MFAAYNWQQVVNEIIQRFRDLSTDISRRADFQNKNKVPISIFRRITLGYRQQL